MRSNDRADAADALRRDVDAIKDDIALLRSDVVATMRDLMEAGRSEAADKKEQIEGAIRDRLDRLNDAAQSVADRGRSAVRSAERYVEDKPLQSLAVAFGVGLLVGAVLRK